VVIGTARVFFCQARDGLFFSVFGEVDEKTGVPVKGTWIQAFPMCIMSFFLSLTEIAKITSRYTLFY
jgi:amino acid transporter